MALKVLPALLRAEVGVESFVSAPESSLGVPENLRPYLIAGLSGLSTKKPIVVVTPTSIDADRMAHDLRVWLGEGSVDVFPAWETLPFERVSPSVKTMGQRLRTMWRLKTAKQQPQVLVASIKALLQRLGPHVEDVEPITVKRSAQLDQTKLLEFLVASGYRREYQVEHRGEVSVRGSIVDVYPSTEDQPIRIDFWGDEVDRLSYFSLADQRSTDDLEEIQIFGCRELLPTDEVKKKAEELIAKEPWGREQWEKLSQGSLFDGMESWLPWLSADEHVLLDLLRPDSQVVLIEPRRMKDRASDLIDEEKDLATSLAKTWGIEEHKEQFPSLHLSFDRLLTHTKAPVGSLVSSAGPGIEAIDAKPWQLVVGDSARVAKELLAIKDWKVIVAGEGEGSATRILNGLLQEGLNARRPKDEKDLKKPGVWVVAEPLEFGFKLESQQLAVLTESEITGRRRVHRPPRVRKQVSEAFFEDLQPGDYVVHHQHGVARYGGMVTRALGGAERDYLLLEYRGDDKLYVPSDQIDLIWPYTGGEKPSLNRLGGAEWNKSKARVRAAVREIAQELVVLYQKRINSPGHAYPPDTPWQKELEDSFPFNETPDQLKAIADVKDDMEHSVPMDRLLCGDVGFGKTEVAVRAAFKAVQDGKQVAVLVPTTLLAQQHSQTFSDRVAGYPVRVEALSRFLTAGQAKKVTDGLKDGTVDVVIGTHRLLSKDVKFKNLGLLIVDEEQRFGVTHKEAIKQLKADVDVLTLTATPIPRTLEMGLTGIRDLTLLNTPPADRQPILTYVGEYDERAVAESIRRELLREGQVFFVHNRVKDIEVVAKRLRGLVPEARIAVAHGQMDEASLEKVVLAFWEGEYDVLVCTTIIESGIDMPTVNTLVVDRSELLGLGQLHQLRGRVGRAGQRAYAYLFFPPDRSLSEQTYERLRTIGELTDLGSGFKIAMRDLEIRGAGNLLGADQSGHIAAVGYDLYVRLVSEAVSELKGEVPKEPLPINLDVPVNAYLPNDYIAREDLRLEAYRRLASVTTYEEVQDISKEWHDRYGEPPEPAAALLEVGKLRALCSRTGISEITVSRNTARMSPVVLQPSQQVHLKRVWPRGVYKEDLSQIVWPIESSTKVDDAGESPVRSLIEFLEDLMPVETSSPVASGTS